MGTPVLLYQSNLKNVARAAGAPRVKFLLPPQCPIQLTNSATDAYSFDQEFEVQLDSFPVASKNTPSNAQSGGNFIFALPDAHAILTGFTQPTPTGARMGRFTGSFSRVPATWYDTQEASYTYPGFPGNIGQTGSRNARSLVVMHRLKYEYFVVDPANVLGSGVTSGHAPMAAAALKDSSGAAVLCVYRREDILGIAKSEFYVAFNNVPDFTNTTMSIVPTAGKTVGGTTYYPTMPDLATYQSWIAKAAAVGWASAVWNGSDITQGAAVGQLVALDSKTEEYAGNILARITQYVLVR